MSTLLAYMARVAEQVPKTSWQEVTTEDLRATIVNHTHTPEAQQALKEWKRRFGKEFLEDYPFYSYLF